jgi:hypothetical protein
MFYGFTDFLLVIKEETGKPEKFGGAIGLMLKWGAIFALGINSTL